MVIPAGQGSNQGDNPSRAERQIYSHTTTVACRDARSASPGRGGTGGGATPPSAFELPFEIPLPPSLPASTSHRTRKGGAREGGFRLQYKLRAKLGSHRKDVLVRVQAANGPSLPPSHWVPRQLPPTALPLLPGGGAPTEVVTLAARVENSHLCRGDAVKLRWACHGLSSARHLIQGVEVRLVECLRWRTSWHEHRDLKALVTQPIDVFELLGHDEDDSSTGSPRGRNRTFQQLGQRESLSVDTILQESLASGHNSLTFAVPECARDTYHGPFIQCWHVVEIRLLLRGSHPGEGGPSQALKVCIGSSPPRAQAVLVSDAPPDASAEVAVMAPPSPTSVVVRQDAREWGPVGPGGDGDPSLANALPWACALPLSQGDCNTPELRYARNVDGPPAMGPMDDTVSSLPPPLSPLRTASV